MTWGRWALRSCWNDYTVRLCSCALWCSHSDSVRVGGVNRNLDAIAHREERVETSYEIRISVEKFRNTVDNAWRVDAVFQRRGGRKVEQVDRKQKNGSTHFWFLKSFRMSRN